MDERFTQAEGTNVYTGCELLVKGALESGVSLLTGYPGSPLAEVFDVIQRNAVLLKENGIVAQIANNEALRHRPVKWLANGGDASHSVHEKRRAACRLRCTRD